MKRDRELDSDSEIRQAVLRELAWDTRVNSAPIDAKVRAGVVALTGSASSWAIRNAAQEAAEVLAAPAKPADVQKSIEDALERRAAREARAIEVVMNDGIAILSGAVQSWAERESVVGAAKATPGVRRVDTRLRIESSYT